MKHLLFLFCILFSMYCFGQKTILENEVIVFSFKTSKGKTCTLTKEKNNNYLVYRIGTNEKIELEFPDKNKDSWKQFKYSYYLRGGGAQNEGMDLNYVSFTHENNKYIIYDTYYVATNKHSIGVKTINLTTHKTSTITGVSKTQKGTLIDFRDNGLLEISEELYD